MAGIKWERLSNGEDWLWRPVERGYCKYESIIDGTLSLDDVATMNELADVADANAALARRALEARRG